MKIDLPELERKLSYGINLTIKESTILLESMQSFIDDKMELQEQLNTVKKALKEIGSGTWHSRDRGLVVDTSDGETVSLFTLTDQALAAIGGDDEL